MWIKAPPVSKEKENSQNLEDRRKARKWRTHASSMRARLLKGIVSSLLKFDHYQIIEIHIYVAQA